MVTYSRYEPHKKKKSKSRWVFLILALALFGLLYYYRRDIYFLFARDQSVRAEKAKEKTIELWKNQALKEQDINDFQSIAQLLVEKDPTEATGYHLIARSLYWNLVRLGIRFDTSSLVLNLGSDFTDFLGKSQLAEETIQSIFWNVRKAEAFSQSPFPDWENNRVLLLLSETHRGVKKPSTLTADFSQIDPEKLSIEFQSMYTWLLTYNLMQAGDANGLEKLIESTKQNTYKGEIKFSQREENFLKGMGKYYKKDFVSALSLLRSAKSDKPDKITETATITEAKIFHLQNLTQKGIDLLEVYYQTTGSQNQEIIQIVKEMAKEKPGAKTKLEIGPIQ
ncbi:hypothetical protein LPTSP4_17730 [Leptospira ryugenii]|uniref:Tetratricopeptide repeat protein n=1 Tax=Leptospira ryugenii TaxID=1917863 RepID=A0A2P2E047_9LEPT|nr:hypothetical protein [Leptospira ryugenii]GBF50249.1 hypothetical protein LPTSP4_17730 [Leptospira ryugenii]